MRNVKKLGFLSFSIPFGYQINIVLNVFSIFLLFFKAERDRVGFIKVVIKIQVKNDWFF